MRSALPFFLFTLFGPGLFAHSSSTHGVPSPAPSWQPQPIFRPTVATDFRPARPRIEEVQMSASDWRKRTWDDLIEMRGVGVEISRYRREWQRADDLLERGFVDEALEAFQVLARDLEAWQVAPNPPRRPVEALEDQEFGIHLRDPRKVEGQVLRKSKGYGRFQGPTLREKLERGRPREPGSFPRSPPLSLSHRTRHQLFQEEVRAAQSAEGRAWQRWLEEADRWDGSVPGRIRPRLTGGTVLEKEHRTRDPDSEHALRAWRGFGGYGQGSRHLRQELFSADASDFPRPQSGEPQNPNALEANPLELPVAPEDNSDLIEPGSDLDLGTSVEAEIESSGGLGDVFGEEPALDSMEPMGGELGEIESGSDLGNDLGGDLDADLGGDLGGDLDADLGGDLSGDLDFGEGPPPSAKDWVGSGQAEKASLEDLSLSPEAYQGKVLSVRGIMGEPKVQLSPSLQSKAPIQLIGVRSFLLQDGASGLEVLVEGPGIEAFLPGTEVRVEGRLSPSGGNSVLIARLVTPAI